MTYTVKATVRRAGENKNIEWGFEGKGSGTLSWNMWRKMRATNRTADTDEPFISAAILRGNEVVESICI